MLTLCETFSFSWEQKEKSPEIRLRHRLGRWDEQVNSVTAPSTMKWEHRNNHCRSERLFWKYGHCRDTPQNNPFIENRLTWSENIHEKENNIKIYIFFFLERIEARLMDLPTFGDHYWCLKQCLFHVLRKLKNGASYVKGPSVKPWKRDSCWQAGHGISPYISAVTSTGFFSFTWTSFQF